jgi:hypothetical protein
MNAAHDGIIVEILHPPTDHQVHPLSTKSYCGTAQRNGTISDKILPSSALMRLKR